MPNKQLLLECDYCLTPTNRINNAAIVIRDGLIESVGGLSAYAQAQEKYRVVPLPGCYALPGFVDTRLYGAGGFDCMHADTDPGLTRMSLVLAEHGVTSFLPTTQSQERRKLHSVVAALARMTRERMLGAVAVGLHIEGPYVSLDKRGAHAPEFVREIDFHETDELLEAGEGSIKVFTFAPELPGAVELTERLATAGVIPCLGHTAADDKQVMAAIAAGANRCSHLYNGMEPLRQRTMALAGIAMTEEDMWVEIIADGIHIHPRMIDLACRCKRKDRIVAISNSNEGAGLNSGTYKLGNRDIVITAGRARLLDGTLAGGVRFMDHNYRGLSKFSHLSPCEAAACFTLNPARSIGLTDRGEIKPGKRADLVILDAHHQVVMTIVEGRIVHSTVSAGAGRVDEPEEEHGDLDWQ